MFLRDADVQEFLQWAAHFTSGDWQLTQISGDRFTRNEVVSLYRAHTRYLWDDKDFKATTKLLDGFRDRMRRAMRKGHKSQAARAEFFAAAKEVIKWGGTPLKQLTDVLKCRALEELGKSSSKLDPKTATMEGLNGFKYMGAGFSKIYSMMLADFPIYDSRVACALTSLIVLFCEDTRRAKVPEALDIGVPPGKTTTQRNPSRRPYVIRKIAYTQKPFYARSNVKAAWLLKHLVTKAPGEFAVISGDRRVRAMEAGLFMLGYERLPAGSVVKGC